jgi:hypothetical protein
VMYLVARNRPTKLVPRPRWIGTPIRLRLLLSSGSVPLAAAPGSKTGPLSEERKPKFDPARPLSDPPPENMLSTTLVLGVRKDAVRFLRLAREPHLDLEPKAASELLRDCESSISQNVPKLTGSLFGPAAAASARCPRSASVTQSWCRCWCWLLLPGPCAVSCAVTMSMTSASRSRECTCEAE